MNRATDLDQARELAALSAAVEAGSDSQEAAQTAVNAVATLVPGAAGTIMTIRNRRLRVAAVSDEELVAADTAQLRLQEGPAVHVVTADQVAVFAGERQLRALWPRWAPLALRDGWRSVLGVRLTGRSDQVFGALTVAHREPRALTIEHAETARLLATHLSVALQTVQIRESLRTAAATNTDVGQALGLLMERFGIDDDQAFTVLRRYSQDSQTKLRDVAVQFIRTGQLPAYQVERS